MAVVDLHSNNKLAELRSSQEDIFRVGSTQGAVRGSIGNPNPNIDRDMVGSGLSGGAKKRKSMRRRRSGRSQKQRKSRHNKRHSSRRRRRKQKGGYHVQHTLKHAGVIGKSAGHSDFTRVSKAGVVAPHKLGAGMQYGAGASVYKTPQGVPYFSTSMKNTASLRGSYPEIVKQTHSCPTCAMHGGMRRRHRTHKAGMKKHKSHRRSRYQRHQKGGYHQYLNGSARSFGYRTVGNVYPQDSALAGHGLMSAYKMGGYGMKGNYNHFTGKNT